MPIAFYYGIAKLDKDTGVSYGSNINDHTIDMYVDATKLFFG